MRRPSGEMANPARTIASGAARVISWPKIEILPAAEGTTPAIAITVLVLPAPFAPKRAVMPALGTTKSIRRTARTGP